jgi:hypothetical protein
MTNWQRLAVILTVLNAVLLIFLVDQIRPVSAADVAPVLRGRALELVDDQGRVRAEIKVRPAERDVPMPDGTTGHPETVLLRLIDSQGSPHVKLAATDDGSGLVLGSQSAHVQILSRGPSPFIKIVNKDRREQLIKP